MTWTDNLIAYCNTGNLGTCPKCGSEDISLAKHMHGTRESLTFTCRKCGCSEHFDGITNMKNK